MRVLLLAADCNPDWPSLPIVGFNTCSALSERVDAVVATHVRNRPALESRCVGKAEVVFIDNEYIAAPMYKAARLLRGGTSASWTTNMAMAYPSYLAFEYEVWKHFGDDLRSGRFDVVHRVTPMSPALPSLLARRCPVPFVIGPLNGGLKWPAQFRAEMRREREWLAYVRNFYRVLPYYRSTYRDAAAVLAAFSHTIADLPARSAARMIDFPEVGIDPERFHAHERQPHDRLTFMFAGRLVPLKCLDVVVAAFAQSTLLRKHRLVIVGDGPERPRLKRMVAENDLANCVEFTGLRPQAEVARIMASADVLVFPSIRELGAGVVVEAMASGLACVVVDYGGPAGLIDATRGIKVPLGTKADLVTSMLRACEELAADPERLARLGRAAHEYALREYSWASKARKFENVYRWVLGLNAHKPAFESALQPV